jgi:hypothetical protein
MALDHGVLNLPLSKRGNIDRQIDLYKADLASARRKADTARFHEAREKKARIRRALDRLPDERVVALAKPLGARKPNTARAALLQAATSNLDRWLPALEREAGTVGCCGRAICATLDMGCNDMAGRCAGCRRRGCDCPPEVWLGPDEDGHPPDALAVRRAILEEEGASMLRRLACMVRGHVIRDGYKVDHPDIRSCRCERCGFRWLQAWASGL